MKVFYPDKLFDGAETLTVQKQNETSCEIHTHEFFEFVYIVKGGGTHTVDGTAYPVGRGSMLFINFGQTHEFCMDDGAEYFNILLLPEYIGTGLKRETAAVYDLFALVLESGEKRQCVRFFGSDADDVQALVNMLYSEFRSHKERRRAAMSDLMHLIVLKILDAVREGKPDAPEPKIYEILDYLKENYALNPSLSEVGKRFYYNSSYFSRLFKRFTGTGFNAYLNSLKINEAIKLLKTTDMTVDAVSQAVGYSDAKTFYAQFRKFTGTTPSALRR